MKLVFDTETTGIAQFKLPPSHPSQPRLVQIAGLVVDDDWSECSSFSLIVSPDGFEIPEQASVIHGITTAKATLYGIPLVVALSVFNNLAKTVSEVWAFNSAFDELIVRSEFHRVNRPCGLDAVPVKCAMLACKDILCLPPNFAGGDYKWPKLSEAYSFFFDGAVFDKAHDALADVRATVKVMQAMESKAEAIAA
jgi:DNA polymerase III epsilon subunit-like protein